MAVYPLPKRVNVLYAYIALDGHLHGMEEYLQEDETGEVSVIQHAGVEAAACQECNRIVASRKEDEGRYLDQRENGCSVREVSQALAIYVVSPAGSNSSAPMFV